MTNNSQRQRRAFLFCAVLSASTSFVAGAQSTMKIRIVSTNKNAADDKLRGVFDTILARAGRNVRDHAKAGFVWTASQPQVVPYEMNCRDIEDGAIAVLSPGVYIDCQDTLHSRGKTLKPILVARKEGQKDEYAAAFVIGAKSKAKYLEAKEIKTLVLGPRRSASGYIAPLHRLWEMGLISRPTVEAVLERGWKVTDAANSLDALELIRRDTTVLGSLAEGTAGRAIDGDRAIRILARYYVIPQDVIVLSPDLAPFAPELTDAILSLWVGQTPDSTALVILNSSMGFTGVVPFSFTHMNEYADLARMKARVYDHIDPFVLQYPRVSVEVYTAIAALVTFLIGTLAGRLLGNRTGYSWVAELVVCLGLLLSWFALLNSTRGIPFRVESRLYLIAAVAVGIGLMLRRYARHLNIPLPGIRASGNPPKETSLPTELGAGLLVAFLLLVVYFGAGSVLFGINPDDVGDRPKGTSFVATLIGVYAAALLEISLPDALRKLTQTVKKKLNLGERNGAESDVSSVDDESKRPPNAQGDTLYETRGGSNLSAGSEGKDNLDHGEIPES
jgi:ABC-type phosphate/phosphonate transport system substrate-binding protein